MSVLYLTEPNASVRLDGKRCSSVLPANAASKGSSKAAGSAGGSSARSLYLATLRLTTPAITALMDQHSEICYLTRFGKFVARSSGD